MIRLDKLLADCGIGTRTEVKKILKQGRVRVNNQIIKDSSCKVDESGDQVTLDGSPVCYEKHVYYMLHKPAGCVTALRDGKHKTIMDYMDGASGKDLAPVGRLDLDTEGLLLITNDGALAHHLLSPAHHVPKTYYARLDRAIPEGTAALFEAGVDIGDDTPTLPAQLQVIDPVTAELTITEGRFHQVKRMFEAVGCQVIYLKRLSMGSLVLGTLPLGEYRKLTMNEIEQLRK